MVTKTSLEGRQQVKGRAQGESRKRGRSLEKSILKGGRHNDDHVTLRKRKVQNGDGEQPLLVVG